MTIKKDKHGFPLELFSKLEQVGDDPYIAPYETKVCALGDTGGEPTHLATYKLVKVELLQLETRTVIRKAKSKKATPVEA